MANKIANKYYDVLSMDGGHGLAVFNRYEFKPLVDEINEIVEQSKRRGYDNDEKWLIVETWVVKKWDDNGVFISEEISKTAFATYDNGKVTII